MKAQELETPQTANYKKVERHYVTDYGKRDSREREHWKQDSSQISNSAETHKYSSAQVAAAADTSTHKPKIYPKKPQEGGRLFKDKKFSVDQYFLE